MRIDLRAERAKFGLARLDAIESGTAARSASVHPSAPCSASSAASSTPSGIQIAM
jgi:hypothetical protein